MSRDAFASLTYATAVRLATVGLSVAVARIGGTVGAGALGVALQWVALASLLSTFNLPQGLAQRLSGTPDPARRMGLLRTSAGLIAAFSLAAGILLTLAAPTIARHLYSDESLIGALRACGLLVVAGSAYLWIEGALQGLRRFGALARWGIAVSLVDLALGIGAAFWGVAAVIVVRALVRAGGVAFAAARWLRTAKPEPNGAPIAAPPETSQPSPRGEPAMVHARFAAGAASLLGFAGPSLLAAVVLMTGHTLLRMLLVRTSGLSAAGHFQAADSIAQGLTLVPLAASAAFMPAVAAHADRGDPIAAVPLQRALEQVTGYNLALCLGAMGLAPWIVAGVFGREFGPSQPVFVLLACAYGFVGPSTLFGAWLMGRGHVWTLVAVNGGWAVAVLAMFRFGTAAWGAQGAALACATTLMLALWTYALIVAPRRSLPMASYLPAVLTTTLGLALGAALALAPGVPPVARLAGHLALAAAVFLRWGFPSIAASGMWPRPR